MLEETLPSLTVMVKFHWIKFASCLTGYLIRWEGVSLRIESLILLVDAGLEIDAQDVKGRIVLHALIISRRFPMKRPRQSFDRRKNRWVGEFKLSPIILFVLRMFVLEYVRGKWNKNLLRLPDIMTQQGNGWG